MNRRIAGITIRTWWTLVIACAVSSLGTWAAFDHANANQARDKRRADARLEAKFRQAIAISDNKHRQALHSQEILFSYSINKTACLLIGISAQQIHRLELTKTAGYKQAETFWKNVQSSQVPIPANFDCSTLPKKPPKPGAPS